MTISVMLPDNPSLPEFVELIGALATRASQAFAAANTLDQLEEARIECAERAARRSNDAGAPAMARCETPGHARHRGDRRHFSRARLHHRDRPGSRDGVVQLRLTQLPAESSGDGPARYAVPHGRRPSSYAHFTRSDADAAALRAADSRVDSWACLSPRLFRSVARARLRA